jgi:hypothetical protein
LQHIQEPALKCILFTNDIVLCGESKEEKNERLKAWRQALEAYWFYLSKSKIDYMEWNICLRKGEVALSFMVNVRGKLTEK